MGGEPCRLLGGPRWPDPGGDSHGDAEARRDNRGNTDRGDSGRAVLRHGPISIRCALLTREGRRGRLKRQRIPSGPFDPLHPRGEDGDATESVPTGGGALLRPVMQGTASPTRGCLRHLVRSQPLGRSFLPLPLPRLPSVPPCPRVSLHSSVCPPHGPVTTAGVPDRTRKNRNGTGSPPPDSPGTNSGS